MKYRHRFHAGNFADVHKHVALLALLRSLQRKPRGLLYVDTHAGAGAYDLSGPDSRQAAEARHGIERLLAQPAPLSEELRHYRDAVLAWRGARGHSHGYPGSAVLAAGALRGQDRALCCESHPQECRALRAALMPWRGVRIVCADGFQQLPANLPPSERRCLALIDPPYEDAAADVALAQHTLVHALQRLANAVIALWYPLKDERWLRRWQEQLQTMLHAPAVCLEMWLFPRDAGVALNGSGLLVINPPWQLSERAVAWQQELVGCLAREGQGGSAVRTLIAEGAPRASA